MLLIVFDLLSSEQKSFEYCSDLYFAFVQLKHIGHVNQAYHWYFEKAQFPLLEIFLNFVGIFLSFIITHQYLCFIHATSTTFRNNYLNFLEFAYRNTIINVLNKAHFAEEWS